MDYLADTGVLLRFTQRVAPEHRLARTAIRKLREAGHRIVFFPQNAYEFWNTATRPAVARGGFGLTITQADQSLRIAERLFDLLPETPAIYPEWRRLVVSVGVSGVQVHDARLTAAMSVHGLTHILTFNDADFTRYPGITAVHPQSV